MTRLLFLPDDQTLVMLDSPLPAADLVKMINERQWMPPEPYATLWELHKKPPFKVLFQGNLVIIVSSMPVCSPDWPDDHDHRVIQLSPRQRQVLDLMLEGCTIKEIATHLGLHPRTVALHEAALKKRLGSTTLAQSIGHAAALGLLKSKRKT
jgi:DNA-binding NarL/FixJ family response regulator